MKTDLTQVRNWIANEKYACSQLNDWMFYPTEGEYAGTAFLDIPSSAVYNGKTGCVLFKLFEPNLDDKGVAIVKISLSYIVENGSAVELKAGNYEEANDKRWKNLSSGFIFLDDLFVLGCIAEAAQEAVIEWVAQEMGNSKQLLLTLPQGESFKAFLWPTVITEKLAAKTGRAVGEHAGLSVANPWFQGAVVQTKGSRLMFDLPVGYRRRTFSEMCGTNKVVSSTSNM